jgi:hypothetical protein
MATPTAVFNDTSQRDAIYRVKEPFPSSDGSTNARVAGHVALPCRRFMPTMVQAGNAIPSVTFTPRILIPLTKKPCSAEKILCFH